MGKLFHSDWWSRALILQEATASTKSTVSVCYGSSRIKRRSHQPSFLRGGVTEGLRTILAHRQWHYYVVQQHGTAYNACADRPANARFNEVYHVFSVFGIAFEEIIDVREPRMWYEPGDDPNDAQLACTWARLAFPHAQHDAAYLSGGTHAEALCHTICIDIFDNDEELADCGYSAEWSVQKTLSEDPVDMPSTIFTLKMIMHKTAIGYCEPRKAFWELLRCMSISATIFVF